MSALVLLLLAQFSTDVFENSAPFEPLGTKDGFVVSERKVKDTHYFENRVEVDTPYAVEPLCNAIYEWGTREGSGPAVKAHKLLKDGENERVVYDQIEQPLVANRDFAMTVIRERLPDGTCRVRFRATNDAAPPKPEGWVRMEKVWGEWLVAPREGGASKLRYTLFSDPAGSVPPFLVHGPQRSSARDSVKFALEKVKKAVAK